MDNTQVLRPLNGNRSGATTTSRESCCDVTPSNGKSKTTEIKNKKNTIKKLKPNYHNHHLIDEFNMVLEANYAEDIHLYHIENEDKQWTQRKCSDFVTGTEVTHYMRSILVDWLIEVTEEYSLRTQTLFLAVNYADRFFEKRPVAKNTVQLVGVACMLIACKIEEIHSPLVDDFVYITDKAYTRENVLQTEQIILGELNFNLSITTVQNFLSRFLILSEANDLVTFLANYLSEMCITVYTIVCSYRPSLLAAASVVVAKSAFSLPLWSAVFEAYTGYSKADLRPCIKDIYVLHEKLSTAPIGRLTSAREKYRKPIYGSVSCYPLSPDGLLF
eukprot:TRINITY_DN1648_c1_g1_i1.p1 TRINITY_DN1648_c1_g1~~TRINITY_DN1648_c1_g1_i1.p1  ORF type:complete len:331 (-),score=22.21 TRINITY_DN1648_c1_g1_i1:197-1189(-)